MWSKLLSTIELGIGVTAAVMLVACYRPSEILDTPGGLYRVLNSTPYAVPFESDRWTVVDDPGRLRVDHGYECVAASRGGTRDYIGIRTQGSAAIPPQYSATVFLNGWNASYTSKDHHVAGLGTVIFNIDQEGSDLVWDAGGLISDKNGDDAFRWCYRYTLLFWPTSSSEIDIRAVHSDSSGNLLFVQPTAQSGVVHSIPGSFTTDGTGRPPRATLPSGVAMFWTSKDHHVLQAGFDLGDPSLSGNTLSWSSSAILKDDRASREYFAIDAVSILRGNGFGLNRPSTILEEQDDGSWATRSNQVALTPRSPTSCAGAEVGRPTHVRQLKVTGLSSSYAVPVLTGWDLGYNCDDQHVRSIGAWIEDFEYVRPTWPLIRNGTLYLTVRSTLADKDGIPNFIDQLEVSVLSVSLPGELGNLGNVPIGGTLQPNPTPTPASRGGSGGGGILRP